MTSVANPLVGLSAPSSSGSIDRLKKKLNATTLSSIHPILHFSVFFFFLIFNLDTKKIVYMCVWFCSSSIDFLVLFPFFFLCLCFLSFFPFLKQSLSRSLSFLPLLLPFPFFSFLLCRPCIAAGILAYLEEPNDKLKVCLTRKLADKIMKRKEKKKTFLIFVCTKNSTHTSIPVLTNIYI